MDSLPLGPPGFWMLFLAGAVVMLLILGISIWRAIGSEGWPRTVGQITGAEVIGGGDGGTAHELPL